MMKEDDYMDQLFKDRFENFSPSPSEQVWEGIAANTTMANGKKLGTGAYWRIGLLLGLTLLISFGVLQGSQWLGSQDEMLNAEVAIFAKGDLSEGKNAPSQAQWVAQKERLEMTEKGRVGVSDAPRNAKEATSRTTASTSKSLHQASLAQVNVSVATKVEVENRSIEASDSQNNLAGTSSRSGIPGDNIDTSEKLSHVFDNMLNVHHLYFDQRAQGWETFNDPLSVEARRDMNRHLLVEDYYEKKKGGHWFVSGYLVADPRLSGDDKFVAGFDGLAFGAGKYLSPNSFVEVSLRGAWSHGFNMRATYAHLFLPGRLRPYVQAGLTWGDDIQLRAGVGLLYVPEKLSKWRFFIAANYEGGVRAREVNRENAGIFEVGAQLRLSGTERVISDNNWMNSIPHYKLPTHWYIDASANFSFDAKTKVTQYSAYMGRYIKKRLFARGGIRVDRENIGVPIQVQYHFLLRQKLRLGAYTGASVELRPGRLGAELGLIAYYDVLPKWSLYVAPVLLENSNYTERLFEMGIQLKLSKKK